MNDVSVLLSVTGLTMRRAGVEVLRGLDWETKRGEHWVIMGANGSGKTTLLGALCGLVTPSGGRLQLLGKVYGEENITGVRKRVGLVSSSVRQMVAEEETALEVAVSGLYGQINFWGKMTKHDVERATAMAELHGWSRVLNRAWGVLSQGERQKVLIARALLADPEVLILDEPCAGLDPAAREHFLETVQGMLVDARPQIVFVTHHVEEILPGITHALGLRDGQVCFSGKTTRELTSANVSTLFGREFTLKRRGGRYSLG